MGPKVLSCLLFASKQHTSSGRRENLATCRLAQMASEQSENFQRAPSAAEAKPNQTGGPAAELRWEAKRRGRLAELR